MGLGGGSVGIGVGLGVVVGVCGFGCAEGWGRMV